jgi:RHS repeat-associated protein
MPTAAKEEKSSAPMVWTDECVLPLAADPFSQSHVTTTAQLSENSRLGFASKTLAPHQGSGFVNSTSALGIEPVLVTEGVRSSSSGRENDGTGMYFYRGRYYSATSSRFISEDPSGFLGKSSNLYEYAFDNPPNLRDPLGLQPDLNLNTTVNGWTTLNVSGFFVTAGVIRDDFGHWYFNGGLTTSLGPGGNLMRGDLHDDPLADESRLASFLGGTNVSACGGAVVGICKSYSPSTGQVGDEIGLMTPGVNGSVTTGTPLNPESNSSPVPGSTQSANTGSNVSAVPGSNPSLVGRKN